MTRTQSLTRSLFIATASVASVVATAGCASSMAGVPMAKDSMMMSQDGVPAAVRVPEGHKVALHTVGAGEITYECREKATMAGQHEWVFAGPAATLSDTKGMALGKYFGPPATWAANDGSAITGAQLATAPGGAGNIPFQLVKANPATGQGAMSGVSYVQRLATKGGVAPASTCDGAAKGKREAVRYQADYLFWKPA